jgi:hypothetical protein
LVFVKPNFVKPIFVKLCASNDISVPSRILLTGLAAKSGAYCLGCGSKNNRQETKNRKTKQTETDAGRQPVS